MMPLTAQLILVTDAFCAASGTTRAAVGGRIFNDGKRFAAIAAGNDLQTRSYERAMAWFDANWPEGAAWPEDVDRPSAVNLRAQLRVDGRERAEASP